VSGRVTSVVVDPTNANKVYLGTAQGGVWRSLDGGSTWTSIFDNAQTMAIGALALAPSDPTILYVDGPMTYMPENYTEEHTKHSLANLSRIIRSTDVRTLIVDHHLLRDRDWRPRLEPLEQIAKDHDVRVQTAAEYAGRAVDQLEANRDRLYGFEPKA